MKLTTDEAWRLSREEGLSLAEIGAKFGVTRQWVQYLCQRHPDYQPRRQASETIRRLAQAGHLNPHELAAQTGVHAPYVAVALRRMGFEPEYATKPKLPKAVDGLLPPGDHRHGRIHGYMTGCRCDACSDAARQRAVEQKIARLEDGLAPDDQRHGTMTGYINWNCRCDQCRAANADLREWRRKQGLAPDDPKHGTENGYSNWGCKCQRCRAAFRDAELSRRESLPPLAPDDPRHGTTSAYRYYGCRCDACREHINAQQRERYRRLGPGHRSRR